MNFILAFALQTFTCAYTYMGSPFVTVILNSVDGTLEPTAVADHFGKKTIVTVTPEQTASGEKFHVTLSKEDPENFLYLVIFEGSEIKSELTNPHVPMAQTMSGVCTLE